MGTYQPLVLTEREPAIEQAPRMIYGQAVLAHSLSDPYLAEFLRCGYEAASGATVTVETAMRNTSLFRAVSLISYAIGMLPLQLIDENTKEKASGHPLYRLLHREPNNWQTAFDFRSLMQLRALVKGNAYALIVRASGTRGQNIIVVAWSRWTRTGSRSARTRTGRSPTSTSRRRAHSAHWRRKRSSTSGACRSTASMGSAWSSRRATPSAWR
jgi:hypothetical protein